MQTATDVICNDNAIKVELRWFLAASHARSEILPVAEPPSRRLAGTQSLRCRALPWAWTQYMTRGNSLDDYSWMPAYGILVVERAGYVYALQPAIATVVAGCEGAPPMNGAPIVDDEHIARLKHDVYELRL